MPAFSDPLPEELEPRTREITSLLEQLHHQPATLINGAHVVDPAHLRADAARIPASEQSRILMRARHRLLNLDPAELIGEADEERPLLVLLDHLAPAGPAAPSTRARRRISLPRILNAIAAVLVVGALIAGALVLFTRQDDATGGSITSPEQPLPCFLTPNADSGLTSICQQHLYQNLNLVARKGQYAVILTRAYADSNRVVFSLRLEELVHGKYTASTHALLGVLGLTDEQNHAFGLLGGTGEGTETDNESVSWYAVPSELSTAAILHLRLTAQVAAMPQRNGTVPAKSLVNIPLQFSISIHRGLRIIALGQSQVIDGVSLKLKDMRISPSEVLINADYDQSFTRSWPFASDLFIGNMHCSSYVQGPSNLIQHIDWPQLVVPAIVISFGCSLYQAHGPAKLIMKNNAGHVIGTFTFTVTA